MSYHLDHIHVSNIRSQLRAGRSPEQYVAVVGVVEQGSEKPITGRNGDHLQFYLEIGGGHSSQVDVNTQSKDGSEILVYIADQDVNASGANPDEPFGAPAYGIFPNAELSYAAMGLNDADFYPLPYYRIEAQLEAMLQASDLVVVYGMTFDDGGPNGKGVHDTHLSTERKNEDGALLVYSVDSATDAPKRTWFFFKFREDSIT